MEKIVLCLHYDGVFTNSDKYVGGKRKLLPIDTRVKYLELLQQVEERLPLKSTSGTLTLSYRVDSEYTFLLEDDKDVESIFILHKSKQGTNGLLRLYVEWTSTGNNMETSTLNKEINANANKEEERLPEAEVRPASKTPPERPSSPGNKTPASAVEGGRDGDYAR